LSRPPAQPIEYQMKARRLTTVETPAPIPPGQVQYVVSESRGRRKIMTLTTRVAPPNSLILVEDSNGGDVPTSMNQSLIIATDSCIAVGCRAEVDGETEITLGYCSSVDTGDRLAFEGLLQTPSRKVVVRTTHNVTLLEMPVAGTETTL